MKSLAYWNYITKKFNYLESPPPDWSVYIPCEGMIGETAQQLYNIRLKMKDSPIEAAEYVLRICCQESEVNNANR